MEDRKPPKLASDERETLTALLRYHRESVVRKVQGLSDDDARRVLVGSGTSLLWIVKHLAYAEAIWAVRRFAGSDDPLPVVSVAPEDTVQEAIDTYRAMWAEVDVIVAAEPTLDAEARGMPDEPAVNLRWVLAHLLDETARHAGHADILRELIDGDTGR